MQTYVFKSGDTLQKIASAYGISLATLSAANAISSGDVISPGNTLIIPANSSTPGHIVYGDGSLDTGDSTPPALLQPQEASMLPAFLAEWLQPPKVYYVIGAAAVYWLLVKQPARSGRRKRRR